MAVVGCTGAVGEAAYEIDRLECAGGLPNKGMKLTLRQAKPGGGGRE